MIRDLLRRNLGFKIVSLVAAYVLWAWAVGQGPVVRQFTVPVDFEPPSADTIVVSFRPDQARVRVQGDPTTVRGLSGSELIAHRKLPPQTPLGKPTTVTIRPRDVEGVPRGVEIQVLDKAFEVLLEQKVRRSVPVEPHLEGEPAEGYEVVRVVVIPPRVSVSGPRSRVEAIDRVRTETIGIDGLAATRTVRNCGLIPVTTLSTEKVGLDPSTVDVRVEIDQVPQVFEPDLAVTPTTTGWSVQPDHVTAKLKITPDLANRVLDRLRATVATDGLPADARVRKLPVELNLDDLEPAARSRIEVIAIEPPKVRVRRQRHP